MHEVNIYEIIYEQTDECSLGGQLSVTFSDIYMVKPRKWHEKL